MSKADVSLNNTWEKKDNKVSLFDDLGEEVIYGTLVSPNTSWSDVPKENIKGFFDKFDVLEEKFPGNSKEDYYQGMNFTRVIREKATGDLYGFTYWEDISKHGEPFVEANGDEHGYDFDWDDDYYPEVFVFLPVREFSVKGFEVIK